ncbi:enoyl-CoA hydratase/isomerase family protein [Nocardia vermiculata]|uniref:Enoyl-CoA hydratase/isomerase family protein n=1 Tax=Nocardia vermiculata TaxID=257274 RepID=A0A846XUJ3_9NOCA|nr:enoyl-CoA hydratase/isomerase family protein [Nocardia vermiculata]NKY49520.1 enoyl-CoA hydratase/isomerase family protein [Nocardia vermiculata]
MSTSPHVYSALRVDVDDGVATLTMDNPPVNAIDAALVRDLRNFVERAERDSTIKVVVLAGANPEFFAAHADFGWMFDPEELTSLSDPEGDPALNPLQQLHERFRRLPQVKIAKLTGRLRAGGVELAMAADMRFAAAGQTWLGQPETRMGIFPGGGGTQYLNRLLGRARTVEVVLSGDLYGTDIAEKYGWINRALPPEQLDEYVDDLARRVAALPDGVATAAMEAIDAAEASGPVPNLTEEASAHAKVYPSPPEMVERMRYTVAAGGQTAAGEIDLEGLLDRAAAAATPD